MPAAQLFITCLVDTFYPETGEAIVSILRRLGVTVDFPAARTYEFTEYLVDLLGVTDRKSHKE